MFQFSGFATIHHVFNMIGCPIRTSTDHELFAPPRSFSQLTTSFVASGSQGIPHTLLFRFHIFLLAPLRRILQFALDSVILVTLLSLLHFIPSLVNELFDLLIPVYLDHQNFLSFVSPQGLEPQPVPLNQRLRQAETFYPQTAPFRFPAFGAAKVRSFLFSPNLLKTFSQKFFRQLLQFITPHFTAHNSSPFPPRSKRAQR